MDAVYGTECACLCEEEKADKQIVMNQTTENNMYKVRIGIWGDHGELCDHNAFIEIMVPFIPRVGDVLYLAEYQQKELEDKLFAQKQNYPEYCKTGEIKGTTGEYEVLLEETTREDFNIFNGAEHDPPLYVNEVVIDLKHVNCVVWVIIGPEWPSLTGINSILDRTNEMAYLSGKLL